MTCCLVSETSNACENCRKKAAARHMRIQLTSVSAHTKSSTDEETLMADALGRAAASAHQLEVAGVACVSDALDLVNTSCSSTELTRHISVRDRAKMPTNSKTRHAG